MQCQNVAFFFEPTKMLLVLPNSGLIEAAVAMTCR